MVDAKTVELINKDVDGLLSLKESRRLKERLSSDSEAKNYYDDLVNLSKMLKQVKPVGPGPNLKKAILNAIPINKYQHTKSKHQFPSLFKTLKVGFDFRLAFAFSIGLVVGFFIYSISTDLAVNDNSNLIGTVLLNNRLGEFKPADKVEIDLNEINGTVVTQSSQGIVLLQIDLTTHLEMELVVEFDENDLSFAGFRPQKYSGGQIYVNSNRLRLVNRGLSKYILVFEDKTPMISQFSLKMFTDELLYQKNLITRQGTNE